MKNEIIQLSVELAHFLCKKNERYGNSAFDPVDIFQNIISCEPDKAVQKILIRLSDKLGRIKNSTQLRKNDVADIIGYLMLIMIRKEWTDLSDLLD